MLLHRHRRRFITCTVIALFHQVEGFPVMVKKAVGVVLSSPLSIPPKSDASWFDDSAAVSTLVTRSSNDVVQDGVFIPTIATMGVLVIICIFCTCILIVNKDTSRLRSGATSAYNDAPVFNGQVDSDHGNIRPSSRISKGTRGSVLSGSASAPGTPSVTSNMLDRLQRQREERHLRQMQQQDPYEQYMSANQGYPYPQQHYQYTPHPSMPGSVVQGVQPHNVHDPTAQHSLMNVNPSHPSVRGSVVQGVQPQLPRVLVPAAQPSLMNVDPSRVSHLTQQERQSLQQSDPRRSFPLSTAQTSSTRVSSDVLSYATPPEARRPPLPNNNSSRPQNQDYFNSQHPASGIPLQTLPSTQGSVSAANYTPQLPYTTNSAQTAHVHHDGFSNQPPEYSTEMINNVQGNAASTTPHREKH